MDPGKISKTETPGATLQLSLSIWACRPQLLCKVGAHAWTDSQPRRWRSFTLLYGYLLSARSDPVQPPTSTARVMAEMSGIHHLIFPGPWAGSPPYGPAQYPVRTHPSCPPLLRLSMQYMPKCRLMVGDTLPLAIPTLKDKRNLKHRPPLRS